MSRQADFDLLQQAVRDAAELTLRYFRKDPDWREKGDGAGPVSEADMASDALLRERLVGARPDYGWLSEETEDDPARLSCDRCWVVDPIDGTRGFLDGRPEYVVSAALVENGRPVLAAVMNPVKNELYAAVRGDGATLNGGMLRRNTAPMLDQAQFLGRGSLFRGEYWRGAAPAKPRRFVASLAYRLCMVATGEIDATATIHPAHEWDLAGAELILTEAGIRVTHPDGAAIGYNKPDPRVFGMIAAPEPLATEIIEKIRFTPPDGVSL